jgi:hypothetical protein
VGDLRSTGQVTCDQATRPATRPVRRRTESSEPLLNTQLLQLGIFGFGGDEDGDVWVGVFPQREKIFVGGKGANAGDIGIRALRRFRLQRVRAGYAQAR